MCRSSTGVEVRRPMRPVESTKIELVAAPAVMVNGVLAPVESSIENLLEPPLAESLAISRQSLAGKPTWRRGVVEVDAEVVLLHAGWCRSRSSRC